MDFGQYDVVIVGAGLSGCVMADRFSNVLNKKVLIVEKRDHIAGNCYDYMDNGILINKYGAHLFHTNDDEVWEYVRRFSYWERWEHKVLASVDDKLVPVPVNITTINTLCDETIKTSDEAEEWLQKKCPKFESIKNSEEMARSRVGDVLYEKMFKNYTKKQWDRFPSELSPDVLARIPIHKDFDDRYFTDRFQALPKHGYTKMCENMIQNSLITVLLNTDFTKIRNSIPVDKIIIYTGPIDGYFNNSGFPKLEYRSLRFEKEVIKNISGYFQQNSVINYPEQSVGFTRIVEYKHFLNQKSPHTVIVREYSSNDGEPYYPVPNKHNQSIYERYKTLAENEHNVHFLGRLATYKYFNMDQAIGTALKYFRDNFIPSA
jgi:UDP-galactopyranose mutase